MQLDDASIIIGLDWAQRAHTCALFGPDKKLQATVQVDAAPEAFGAWLEKIERAHPQGRLVVAVERDDGAAVQMMRARARWSVVPINPVVLHRFRQAFAPSGAKNDPGDATLLGEIVLTHPEKFTALPPVDEQLGALATLVEQRRHWVDTRTGLLEQLGAVLQDYYPQALALAGDNLACPMAREFLRRWPDLAAAQQAGWSTLEAFYRSHHSGQREVLARRQALLAQAQAVSTTETYVGPRRLHMRTIVAQLEALGPSIAQFDAAIAELFAQAPGHEVIDSLPGAGPALAPRLWVACQQAGPHPAALDLALASGVAPVQRQSGETKTVAFRWARPRFLHQTWIEFAMHSIAGSQWAADYYKMRRKKGHGRHAIHRALAFKWTRIVAQLWREHICYDEPRYLQQRAARLANA